jgi:hypothetical protein
MNGKTLTLFIVVNGKKTLIHKTNKKIFTRHPTISIKNKLLKLGNKRILKE